MNGKARKHPEGPTPLAPEEERDLVRPVANRAELNAFERENILEARRWALSKGTLARVDLLTETFLRELHRRMFGNVWRWAGIPRTTERNMGAPVHRIPTDVRLLLEDTRYWFAEKTYPPDEAAVRFHYRLVTIHPWPNGNGRHARLMADILASAHGAKSLPWSQNTDLVQPGSVRQRYLDALHDADNGNFQPLLAFARE